MTEKNGNPKNRNNFASMWESCMDKIQAFPSLSAEVEAGIRPLLLFSRQQFNSLPWFQ